ncbi:hypothetical protein GCM10009679_59990 [Saccharothrix algeriensis]
MIEKWRTVSHAVDRGTMTVPVDWHDTGRRPPDCRARPVAGYGMARHNRPPVPVISIQDQNGG